MALWVFYFINVYRTCLQTTKRPLSTPSIIWQWKLFGVLIQYSEKKLDSYFWCWIYQNNPPHHFFSSPLGGAHIDKQHIIAQFAYVCLSLSHLLAIYGTKGKNILEQLSRTGFFTGFRNRAFFLQLLSKGKKGANFKSRKKSCSWKLS